MTGNLVDFAFYIPQRCEAGHTRTCYEEAYDDATGKPLSSGSPVIGTPTIGYGLAKGHSVIPFPSGKITEEQAIDFAKQELAYKVNEMCRRQFKDFDNLLPCYQAAILYTTFQGTWKSIQDPANNGDMMGVHEAITNTPNKEAAAVLGRAIEMGMMIEQVKKSYPNADPRQVAQILANEMIARYAELNGTDCELTKDELALLYRSCMAAWGIEVPEEEIERFALSFENVASGTAGIGSQQPAPKFNGYIPELNPNQHYHPRTQPIPDFNSPANQARIEGRSWSNGRAGAYGSGSYRAPSFYVPEAIGPNKFTPDSKTLKVSTADVSCNFSSRCGKRPKMIVIHTTESPHYGATKNTFQSRSSGVSAHYVIKPDGTIMQYLPEGVKAWHAGDSKFALLGIQGCCNAESIGIEIECPPGQPQTPEQVASTMALCKDIQVRHGPVRDVNGNLIKMPVVGHSDIAPGRKADPGKYWAWAAFDAEGISDPSHRLPTTPQSHDPKMNAIRSTDCTQYITPTEPVQTVDTKTTPDVAAASAENERKRQSDKQGTEAAMAAADAHSDEVKLTTRLRDAELAGQTPDETHTDKTLAADTASSDGKPSSIDERLASSEGKTDTPKKKSGKRKNSGGGKKALAKNDKEDKTTSSDKDDAITTDEKTDNTALAVSTPKKPIGTPVKDDESSNKKTLPDNGKGIA